MSCRKASSPDRAFTRFCPKPSSMASRASRLAGRSSTKRILTGASYSAMVFLLSIQPGSHQREQLFGIHRFGDVIRSPRFNAFFAVALHGLGGQGDDGDELENLFSPDGLHG